MSATCRLRAGDVHVEVWLDNCQLGANHTVTLTKVEKQLGFVTDGLIQNVVCKQISNEGVIHNVSVGITVTEDSSIPTKAQVLDNGVRIITRLGDNTSGAQVPVVPKIVWDIQIAEFRIIPEVCSYLSSSGPVILLQDGCTKAPGQVSNFVSEFGGGFLMVYPVRFSDRASNDVAIVCSVRLCAPADADSCSAKCGSNGKRRRRRHFQRRSTSGVRSEVAILTLQFESPKVTSRTVKSLCPTTTPTVWMISSLIFLVLVVM